MRRRLWHVFSCAFSPPFIFYAYSEPIRNTGRRIFQQISTLGAFDALHNSCPAQAGKHLLQILGRDLISLSNTSECHMTVFRIDCQINESRHSVSAFFGKFHSLLYCLECLIQVLNNIVDILGTNGKTDGIRFDSLIQKFFFCTLAVCGGRRMNNQRLHVSYICKQGE